MTSTVNDSALMRGFPPRFKNQAMKEPRTNDPQLQSTTYALILFNKPAGEKPVVSVSSSLSMATLLRSHFASRVPEHAHILPVNTFLMSLFRESLSKIISHSRSFAPAWYATQTYWKSSSRFLLVVFLFIIHIPVVDDTCNLWSRTCSFSDTTRSNPRPYSTLATFPEENRFISLFLGHLAPKRVIRKVRPLLCSPIW